MRGNPVNSQEGKSNETKGGDRAEYSGGKTDGKEKIPVNQARGQSENVRGDVNASGGRA